MTTSAQTGLQGTAAIAPGVDLLRALAIIAVMLYHLSSHGIALPGFVEHGWMGVDLFFVLSGYLIGWQVLREYAHHRAPHWRGFMVGRALRILPAYYTVLALYMLFPAGREGGDLQPAWKFLTFSINLFPDWDDGRAYSHAWSLCVEEHFYLLFPLTVWLLAGRSRAVHVGAVALGVLMGGMLIRAWCWHEHVAPYIEAGEASVIMRGYVTTIYNPTYARLDGLLAGVMLAAVRAFRPQWWEGLLRHGWSLIAAGAALLFGCTLIRPVSQAGAIVLFPLIALGCTCLLAGALSAVTPIGRHQVPGARTLAVLSFSLYLTHKQAYALVDAWRSQSGDPAPAIAFTIYILVSVAIAFVLYMAVERPGLRLRAHYLHGRGSGATLPSPGPITKS